MRLLACQFKIKFYIKNKLAQVGPWQVFTCSLQVTKNTANILGTLKMNKKE